MTKKWKTENENAEGWKTVTIEHDDWTEVFRIYVEDGKVIRGTDEDCTKTLYPYRYEGNGSYSNASGVKYETFRDGYQKGTYSMK